MKIFEAYKVNFFRYSLLVVVFTLLIFICFSLVSHFNAEKVSPLANSYEHIKQEYRYFVDPNNTLTVEQVQAIDEQFIATEFDRIPFKLGLESYWIKLVLRHEHNNEKRLVVHVDNPMLAEFDAYILPPLGEALHKLEIPNDAFGMAFPHIEIDIKAHQTKTILFKVRANGPPNIPIVAYEQNNFNVKTDLLILFYGAFIGIVMVMSIYNLVLFAAIRDKVYLIYVGYLLTSLVVLASVVGFGYFIFAQALQEFINHYSLFFHYYLVTSLLLFTLYFLHYDKTRSKLYWVGIVLVVLQVVLSITTLWLSHELQATLFFSLLPLFYVFTLVVVIKRINKEHTWARFYFLSWLPLLLGAAVQPLVLLNLLEYSFLTRNAFLFAILVEIAFMAFALAERMRRFEAERIREISYHPNTDFPRKTLLERKLNEIAKTKDSTFSLLIIEPEQIERVALYLSEKQTDALIEKIYKNLTSLFYFNDAITVIGDNNEKLCLLSDNRFSILVDHKFSQQSLNMLMQSIRIKVEEVYQLDGLSLPLSCVIGIANFPEHGHRSEVLVNRAKVALQQAVTGHKKWDYFEFESSRKTSDYLALASELKEAIEHERFTLYHQPQIDLKTMKVCGSEVLLRWLHPSKGVISPELFIPIAEDMGLINKITQWVVKQAVKQQQDIIELGYNHMVSINISGKDVASDDFYEFVIDTLNKSEISANKLAFELTESAVIKNNEKAKEVIELLNALGITISIDDFGTGYSSMAYVSELPFQELKVDRQFVQNIAQTAKQKVIAEATVKMAKGLGLEVVAEGINSLDDENILRDFGCDIGQGYYYAKPMAFDNYIDWLSLEMNGRVKQKLDADLDGEFIPKQR